MQFLRLLHSQSATLATALSTVVAPLLAGQGNAACWKDGFTFEGCCGSAYGEGGNAECWDGIHTQATCCLESQQPEAWDDLIERGKRGDASVLPRLMQIVSAGGEAPCAGSISKSERCAGTSVGPSAKEWHTFFEANALSRYMRLQPWPAEGDPGRLFRRCCLLNDAQKVLQLIAEDCAAGAVALVLSSLPYIERQHGQSEAQHYFAMAQEILHSHDLPAADCHWKHQVNVVAFHHHAWFLDMLENTQFSCGGAKVRVFLDERPEWAPLRAHPMTCSQRGLCFTEVWIHQFLRHAACRVSRMDEADFVYIPVYSSCHGLDATDRPELAAGVKALVSHLEAPGGLVGPQTLLVFTGEMWKLRGWRSNPVERPGTTVAAVEAKPLFVPTEQLSSATGPKIEDQVMDSTKGQPAGQRRTLWHCQNCFDSAKDLIIPSAVYLVDAMRLRGFRREPLARELLLVWHGEHAEAASREDVREGYREVNETVRLDLIRHFTGKPNASVGEPSMRYSFLMGNAHFCLIPRGRGWWTVRLFEAFYAGCVPVLLSDEVALPFEDFLDWERFSLKWPMRRVGQGLYERLEQLLHEEWPRLAQLHAGVREVACWFDYHAPEDAECSPYLGLLKQLEQRSLPKAGVARRPRVQLTEENQPLLQRFWF